MSETLVGYARCSTDAQDLTAQRDRLRELGVAAADYATTRVFRPWERSAA